MTTRGIDRPSTWRATGSVTGRYRYYEYPLPPVVAELREHAYPYVAGIANRWAERLGEPAYPSTHAELLRTCKEHGQVRPTPLILGYREGDWNALHQDIYGDVVFPLQIAIALTRPGVDYDGGAMLFVEQRPRMQSRCYGDARARPRRRVHTDRSGRGRAWLTASRCGTDSTVTAAGGSRSASSSTTPIAFATARSTTWTWNPSARSHRVPAAHRAHRVVHDDDRRHAWASTGAARAPRMGGADGWLATNRGSFKAKHLAENPWVSLAFWDQEQEQVYVDCHAMWVDDELRCGDSGTCTARSPRATRSDVLARARRPELRPVAARPVADRTVVDKGCSRARRRSGAAGADREKVAACPT